MIRAKGVKKILPLLLLAVSVLGLYLLNPSDAQAARSEFNRVCFNTGTPNDIDFFPYGFMCGSDPSNIQNIQLDGVPKGSENAYISPELKGGSSLTITGSYTNTAGSNGGTTTPREHNGSPSDEVMVWTYIDANDDTIQSITDQTSGGIIDQCPGTGSGRFPAVRGHRDLAHGVAGGYGPDQSPYAYVSPDYVYGKIDCGTQGKMVYWRNASPGQNYRFKVNFNREANDRICIRQMISVKFDADGGRIFTPTSDSIAEDQNTLASHIVKQSNQLCYFVKPIPPPPPVSGSTNTWCTKATVQLGTYYSYQTRARVSIGGVTGDTSGTVDSADDDSDGDGRKDQTFNYTPTNNNVNGVDVRVQRDYYYDGPTGSPPYDGSTGHRRHNTWYNYSDGHDYAGPCYSARCTIDPVDKVVAGSTVTLRAYIQNDVNNGMELRTGLLGTYPLALEKAGGSVGMSPGYTPTPSATIPVGGTAIIDFTVQANPDASGTNASLVLQSAYVGRFSFGSQCGVNIPIYQPPVVVDGAASCPTVRGRAYHPEAPGMIISVHIYVGPTFIGAVNADGPAQSFSFTIPEGYMNGLDQTFTLYAIDPFGIQNGGPVNVGMVGCGKFHLEPSASGVFDPSDEDPAKFTGTGTVNPAYPGWAASASRPALPGTGSYYYEKNGVAIPGTNKPYPYSTFTPRTYTAETIDVIPPVIVGDRYCLKLTVTNANGDGYIQRDGVVLAGTGPVTVEGCRRIENKPFVKVYGSAVSAGGAFKTDADGSCTGGGSGFLGGWFNNTYSGSYSYGTSTELSALAMVKTVGFASAQTVAKRSPSELSMANTVAADKTPSPSSYSPGLGGNFGSASCLTDVVAPANASTVAAGPGDAVSLASLGKGAYKVNGNASLSGFTLNPGTSAADTANISLFVNGDVRINGDIKYNDSVPWVYSAGDPAKNTTPSFVLYATGNIYISPGVKVLDGQYIARPKTDGSAGGNIYTCGHPTQSYAAMPKDSMFDNCSNQLTVHGSFVANKVRLMRTYGTLRDEKPTVPAGNLHFTWSTTGPVAGKNCVLIYDAAMASSGWGADGNKYLCAPVGVALRWTESKASTNPAHTRIGNANPAGVAANNCSWPETGWPAGQTWFADNQLCASVGITVSLTGPVAGKECIAMTNPTDPTSPWDGTAYVCYDSNIVVTSNSPKGLSWTFVGDTAGKNCVKIFEPWSKYWTSPYEDNYLCAPISSGVAFKWSHAGAGSTNPSHTSYGSNNPAGVTDADMKYCTNVNDQSWTAASDVQGIPYAMREYWSDNYLCSNIQLDFAYGNSIPSGKFCTAMTEGGDPNLDNTNAQVWGGKAKICENLPDFTVTAPATVPSAAGCSNGGASKRSSPRPTCAAEVFEYWPEFYLSTPAIKPENGDGAKTYDSITSLPPVL